MTERDFASHGFAFVPQVLDSQEVEAISAHLSISAVEGAGSRHLLARPWCESLASQLKRRPSLATFVPAGFVAVQCSLFEKSLSRNWLVAVHQDLSIPVASFVDHPLLKGWSEKEGGLHVQPPTELLQQLVAVRVQIDHCAATDGPLRVVPGSHLRGRIDPEAAAVARRNEGEVSCRGPRGSAWIMRPLLLHASSRASGTSRRRVLHFLFGPRELPHGLRWQHAI
jgi:hypothetical protein